jgi:type VI secretion system protein ImpL
MTSILKRVLGLLCARVLWVVIGILALILLIWFFGPLFAFGETRPLASPSARLWLIGLIAGYLVLRFLIGRWRAGRMNDRIAGVLRSTMSSSVPAQAEDSAEVGILRERFSEALDVLRKARFEKTKPSFWSRLLRQGKYVYELPWYVIIGAPGVGKTTALLNSGLSFPLAKQFGASAIRGIGGTRNCDWWFTNEAVFIDTAGRYTTHGSDAKVDKAEWLGFLSLLKKFRTRQPINGVLVTLSVSDMLELNHEGRLAYAATLRRRLDELRIDLGMTFPVYLLVNKCDLMLGFDETFSTLDRNGREQVWGVTLPLASRNEFELDRGHINKEIGLLRTRIVDGLVDTLQGEPDINRRALIYTFPQQFNVLTQLLEEMLGEMFAASRYSTAPLLRGIYFTSATQEGTPFDRIVHALGQGFQFKRPAKPAASGEGKAFFLQELLTKVVFAEAYVGDMDQNAERRSRAFHIGSYAACVAALCGALVVWANSYRHNVTYIAEVDEKTAVFARDLERLPEVNGDNVDVLMPALNLTEALPDSNLFKVDGPPLGLTFGLYQGEKLKAGARSIYRRLLAERFGPTLKGNLEHWLRTMDVQDIEFAYETLKTYLMMHDPEHFDADKFVAFAQAVWGHDVPQNELNEERNALARHVRALVASDAVMSITPVDKGLVQATRNRLAQYTASQRAYRRTVKLLRNNPLPDFSVASEVGEQVAQVFRSKSGQPLSSGVPSLYTYKGYHNLFKNRLVSVLDMIGRDDSWVLGVSGPSLKELTQRLVSGELEHEVKRQYMNDYVANWEKYLDDITLIAPQSLTEAARLADMLSGVDSSLVRYLRGVVRETTLLGSTGGSDESLIDRASRTIRSGASDLQNIVPKVGGVGPKDVPEEIVDKRFAALREAVNGGDGDASASPLLASAKVFEDLYNLLIAAKAAQDNGTLPPSSDLTVRLRASAERLPRPGRDLFEQMAVGADTLMARQKRQVIDVDTASKITVFCRESIQGRYPFANSKKEVTFGDFRKMFGPNGDMDRHFQENLASVTDTSSRPWKLRPGAQGGGSDGRASLAAFEKANIIKDVFFRNSADTPQITMTIKPLDMDATITTLTMDVDGKIIRYRHGPQLATTVTWPAGEGRQEVSVSAEPPLPAGQGANSIVRNGPWALYRLFDDATIVPGDSPERFQAVFNIGGRKATFEVVASSVRNPLRLPELKSFSCPSGL